jgi:hypothetical protein
MVAALALMVESPMLAFFAQKGSCWRIPSGSPQLTYNPVFKRDVPEVERLPAAGMSGWPTIRTLRLMGRDKVEA